MHTALQKTIGQEKVQATFANISFPQVTHFIHWLSIHIDIFTANLAASHQVCCFFFFQTTTTKPPPKTFWRVSYTVSQMAWALESHTILQAIIYSDYNFWSEPGTLWTSSPTWNVEKSSLVTLPAPCIGLVQTTVCVIWFTVISLFKNC